MPGRSTADIVFVIDASSSMQPWIDGVRDHITRFVQIFEDDPNGSWDIRLEMVAHSTRSGFSMTTIYETRAAAIYGQGRFFTADVSEFARAVDKVSAHGNEAPAVALDCALDLPWRDRFGCRRIVILLTDEPLEHGARVEESQRLLPKLVDKINDLKVLLFLVSPDSPAFEELASANRAVWEVVSSGGEIATGDLGSLLMTIGKSISKSQSPLGSLPVVERALFGQDR